MKNWLGREHGRCTPKKSHSLSCKWRRFHAFLSSAGQSFHRGKRDLIFSPPSCLEPAFDLWSRDASNPRRELHTFDEFIRLSRKPPVYSLILIPSGTNPRELTAFSGNRRDTKSNYVDLRLVHGDSKHPLSPWLLSFTLRNFVAGEGW